MATNRNEPLFTLFPINKFPLIRIWNITHSGFIQDLAYTFGSDVSSTGWKRGTVRRSARGDAVLLDEGLCQARSGGQDGRHHRLPGHGCQVSLGNQINPFDLPNSMMNSAVFLMPRTVESMQRS